MAIDAAAIEVRIFAQDHQAGEALIRLRAQK